ncbi:MAG: HAMP domain-containing histidine kinase [Bacteroidota bacterium]|nr:HAMP domain-containing histidine kinase [Bacteroidota bacterium]
MEKINITRRSKAPTALTLVNVKQQRIIQELQKKNRDLQRMLDHEKVLNKQKLQLLSMASHELRIPLSTILSSAFLLQRYSIIYSHEKQQEQLNTQVGRIIASVQTLSTTLNNFMGLHAIGEGKITPYYSLFNLSDLIGCLLKDVKVTQKKGQRIAYQHSGNTLIYLDSSLLKNIVLNLVNNAIKFSPPGSTIKIETNTSATSLILKVADNGIGISKDNQQHLFEQFYRCENTSSIQGTGLGLFIVKSYTEAMNGIIQCQSDIDKGCTFTLTFNLKTKANLLNTSLF